MAFQMFISTAKAKEKRVLGGIDYYYDSKTACESNDGDEQDDLTWSEEKSRGSTLIHGMFDETADEDTNTSIPLTEADLKTFKAEQISP